MLVIPTELATRAWICGTPDDAIEQIEEFIKAGVRLLVIHPNYEISPRRTSVNETIENYRRKILPNFAELRRLKRSAPAASYRCCVTYWRPRLAASERFLGR